MIHQASILPSDASSRTTSILILLFIKTEMLPWCALVMCLTVGSFKKDIVTDEYLDMYHEVRSDAQRALQEKGWNGVLATTSVDEVWTQTVSGRNVFLRVDDTCISLHDHFGEVSLTTAGPCANMSGFPPVGRI